MTHKYTVKAAFKALGGIDTAHESGKISKRQHDSLSLGVLKKLVRKK